MEETQEQVTEKLKCPACKSDNLRPVKDRKHSFRCRDCDKQFRVHAEEELEEQNGETSAKYSSDGENIYISFISDHIPTTDEVAAQYNVNLNEWELKSFESTHWQSARKDKQVDLTWDAGLATGTVKDTGKMTRTWLHRINVKFIRKVEQIRLQLIFDDMKTEALKYSPKYPQIIYKPQKNGMLLEIDIPDIHFGRLTWEQESGENFDIKIAARAVNEVLDELLGSAKSLGVSQILLPIGNDFYNVNNKAETTVHGTPQQEDTRWQKTFKMGRQLAVSMIEKCSQIAPVDVLIIAGNHDEERSFYLGDALECWFNTNKEVRIDNTAKKRKYFHFGANLIGFTHGYWEKPASLPLLMAQEQPRMWADSLFREFHLGDKHHKKDMVTRADEGIGVTVRFLRSLTAADAWTFDKGFVGSLKAAEAFLWHPDRGLKAQFTAIPERYE